MNMNTGINDVSLNMMVDWINLDVVFDNNFDISMLKSDTRCGFLLEMVAHSN